MGPVIHSLLQVATMSGIKHFVNCVLKKDFAYAYDENVDEQTALLSLTLSISKGLETLNLDANIVSSVSNILHTNDVCLENFDPSQLPPTAVDAFITCANGSFDCEYEYRYLIMQSILFILYMNNKNIENYQDIIKLAIFLKLKKTDFIYLLNKYKR